MIDTQNEAVERPHIGWWISILFGMGLTSTLACSEQAYALFAEHVTGLLPRSLIQKIFVIAWLLHVGEALYARQLAKELGYSDEAKNGWTFQTFLLGFPSLSKLLRRRNAAR